MNRSKLLLATIATIGIFIAPLFADGAAAPTDDLWTAIQKGLLNAVTKAVLAEIEKFTVEQAGWINKSGQFERVEFEPIPGPPEPPVAPVPPVPPGPPGPGSEPKIHWGNPWWK